MITRVFGISKGSGDDKEDDRLAKSFYMQEEGHEHKQSRLRAYFSLTLNPFIGLTDK